MRRLFLRSPPVGLCLLTRPNFIAADRKTFSIPAGWGGSVFFLDFGGSFRNTTVWVNGNLVSSHECGYTPFRIRLDNITSVKAGGEVTIAVFVDPDNGDVGGTDHGSGWWYEGGGLCKFDASTRHQIEIIGLWSLISPSRSLGRAGPNFTGAC